MRRATVREDTRIGGSEPIYNRPSNASSGVPVDRRGAPMGYTSEEIEGMRNTRLFIGQTPRGYHGSVGHLAVPSELYHLRHGGKKAHSIVDEPTIKGGKLKKKPKKGSKIRGGDVTDIFDPLETKVLYYSKLEPNGYNPILAQQEDKHQHWQVGGNDYNQPYLEWINKHPWMVPFGEVAEEYVERYRSQIEGRKEDIRKQIEAVKEEERQRQKRLQDLQARLVAARGYSQTKSDDLWKQFNVAADKAKAFLNSLPPLKQQLVETQTTLGYKGSIDPSTKQYLDLFQKSQDIWNTWQKFEPPAEISRQIASSQSHGKDNAKKYNDLMKSLTSPIIIYLNEADQREWLRGYDEIQWQFNRWTHEVWRKSLDPDRWGEPNTPYNLGRIWASMYNRSWQPQVDWRSTGEQILDQFKENFNVFKDIGTTIAEIAA
jgi:hypothetical protein